MANVSEDIENEFVREKKKMAHFLLGDDVTGVSPDRFEFPVPLVIFHIIVWKCRYIKENVFIYIKWQ